jgi:uncharacterized protein
MIGTLALVLAAISIPPAPNHYVTDTVGVLAPQKRDALENELHRFDTKTGNQVIVWIGSTTGGAPLEEWTSEAAERWKVGHKDKDNGAILFLFMGDRRTRIEVGYGLEPKLTDARSAQIISEYIVPMMRQGNVDSAVQSGVDQMLIAIDPDAANVTEPAPATAPSVKNESTIGPYIVGIFMLVVLLFVILTLVVTTVRRGKKHGDWMDFFLVSPGGARGAWGGGSGGGGFSGGFVGGGGGFGGGGASGGW